MHAVLRWANHSQSPRISILRDVPEERKAIFQFYFYRTTHFLTQGSPGLAKDKKEPLFPAGRSLQGEDRLGLIRLGTKIGPGVGPEWGRPKEGRRRWKRFETDPSLSTSSVFVR